MATWSLMADNWGIPLFLTIYFLIWLIVSISTYNRRELQPLKACGQWTMQFSGLSLIILSACLTEEVFYANVLNDQSFCTLWQWAASFFYCGCIVPYFLRTHRLRFLYNKTKEFVELENKSKRFRYHRHYKYWMQENRIILLIIVICLMMFAFRFLIDEMTSNYNYHLISIGCDEGTNLDFASVIWIVIHFIECLALIWCVNKLKPIKQEFSIRNELHWVAFIWITATILSVIVYLYATITPFRDSVESNHDNSIDIAWILNACCELYRFVFCYLITAIYPLYCTIRLPQQSIPLFSNCRILYSIDLLLSDMNGVHYFREFLRQNQGIELLLFWIEVEIYKDYFYEKLNDHTIPKKIKVIQLYSQALRIFDKFIKNEAEFKIDQSIILQEICANIAEILGQQDKYDILASSQSQTSLKKFKKSARGEVINHVYSFPSSKMYQLQNIFDDAQNKCYQILKSTYFPTFLADPLCDGLLNKLKIEERFYDALKRSHMIR
eukprot:137494_1